MKVRIHPHAAARMKERGSTRPEVEYAVKHGTRFPAKYGRTRFRHTFAYNRKWLGTSYRRKTVDAFAVGEGEDDWLVISVIVRYG